MMFVADVCKKIVGKEIYKPTGKRFLITAETMLEAEEKLENLNIAETDVGEPMYPKGMTILIEPVEFGGIGVTEI